MTTEGTWSEQETIDPNPKLEDDEEMTDEELMMEMPLDVIVRELQRRHCPVIFANGLGMTGRVLFIPASMEVIRAQREKTLWRQEIRRRNAEKSATGQRVGLPAERQVHNDLVPEGSDPRFKPLTGGPIVSETWKVGSDGDEGSEGIKYTLRSAAEPPTTGTPGI